MLSEPQDIDISGSAESPQDINVSCSSADVASFLLAQISSATPFKDEHSIFSYMHQYLQKMQYIRSSQSHQNLRGQKEIEISGNRIRVQ